MTTLGQHLIALLAAHGVSVIFGIPGVHTAEAYRGLPGSGIRHVTPRHEQGAGFMADGYARVTGEPGVCLVITGPGLSNVATAMLQARADSVPMLVITSTLPIDDLGAGRGGLHEMPDQRAFAAAVALTTRTVGSAAELEETLARAFAIFRSARPGPVHLEIPRDRFAAPVEVGPIRPPAHVRPPVPDAAAIGEAVAMLQTSASPVVIVGGGARRAARGALALAERLDCPLLATINARSALPLGHPLVVPCGVNVEAAQALVDDADLTLAFGTEMGPTDYRAWSSGKTMAPRRLVRVDIDPEQLFRSARPDLALVGDAAGTIDLLLEALGPGAGSGDGTRRAAAARAAAEASLAPDQRALTGVLDAVREAAPTAALVGDSTQLVYAGNHAFAAGDRGHWFNAATGFGTLGYALPAGLGARLGRPEHPVIVLIGDGGLQFVLGELGTLAELGGTVVVLVWNSNGYLEIRRHMEAQGIPPEGVELAAPDFVMIAGAYGIAAEALDGPDGVGEAVARAVARGGPTLIEVRGV
ncbi:5-guanidino-2-oxopentanoate decarboxylase [Acuticoccus sp.]|uniref:5-guanidino-2-oxopentanoate decarboxylase n=1 Tax=Acuticoccus sp. TaxID=1904378 RepID=UPI003B51FF5D